MGKPTIVLDFDGVLHSYTTPWSNARTIPDPPVPGALEALVGYLEHFEVAIVSSRSHQWGGRRAMRRWLRKHLAVWNHDTMYQDKPEWVHIVIMDSDLDGLSHEQVCRRVATEIVRRLRFPRHKPAAILTLDDRAITFEGRWPRPEQIKEFKPWNRRDT